MPSVSTLDTPLRRKEAKFPSKSILKNSNSAATFLEEPASAALRKYQIYKLLEQVRNTPRVSDSKDSTTRAQNNFMTVSSDGKITPAEAIKSKRRDSSAHDTINLISSAVDSLNKMSMLIPS